MKRYSSFGRVNLVCSFFADFLFFSLRQSVTVLPCIKFVSQSQFDEFLSSGFELSRQYFSVVLDLSLVTVESSFLDYLLSMLSLKRMVLFSSLVGFFFYFLLVFLPSSRVSFFLSLFYFFALDFSFANLRLMAEL